MTRTRFIEKGGRCTAECPNGTMPGPHEGTDCLFGGRWSHRINCYKPCPDIDLGHGVLVVEGRNTSNRKLEGTGYDCSGGPYVTGTTECPYFIPLGVIFLLRDIKRGAYGLCTYRLVLVTACSLTKLATADSSRN